MKMCWIAQIRHWWTRRRYYVYIYEDFKPPASSLYQLTKKLPEESNQGVPEQTIITDSSGDSTPNLDTTTVYTTRDVPFMINKLTSTITQTTTARPIQSDKPPRFGIDQMEVYFVSSRSCASLCSIDSLSDSNWGPSWKGSVAAAEDADQSFDDDFFREHVRFLRIQTAPHQVETIWSPPSAPSPRTCGCTVEHRLCEV